MLRFYKFMAMGNLLFDKADDGDGGSHGDDNGDDNGGDGGGGGGLEGGVDGRGGLDHVRRIRRSRDPDGGAHRLQLGNHGGVRPPSHGHERYSRLHRG